MNQSEIKNTCSYCEKPFTADNDAKTIKERYGDRYLKGLFHADCGEIVLDGIDATIAMAGA